MGRGNLNKKSFQAATKQFAQPKSIDERIESIKRKRPNRDQPPTLPNVDVHGILFAIVAICA